MARGATTHASSPVAAALPKIEYEIAKDEVFKLPAGVFDQQARAYGYNDFSEFRRPENYIRHIEPLESDLAKTVEYDMDEQDQEWLEAVNNDRKKEQMDKVSCEAFEIILDRLEKEWFDLTKNIPKLDFAMPSEDSTCAICDDSEGENSNAIVFCDGCNLAVHQDCYGVPYIPEGQWLCRKCTVSPENPVSCALCPNEGGAFKQTLDGVWVHLLCAIWVPETRVMNEVFMEPVAGLDRISKGRWKLRCELCGIKNAGACIQCTKPSCFAAFHTTCARKEKLLMPMKSAHGSEPASLTAFCDRHLPPEQQQIRAAALTAEESSHANTLTAKSARAYAKTYKPGPPLVPAIVVDRILTYIARIKIRKKQEFVQQMCRYWSLKREARRGAPLLKRLHLEPWTASGGGKVLSEEEKLMKLNQLGRLKEDLFVLKDLTELVRKREMRKLRQAEVIYDLLSRALFPHHMPLRHVFEKLMVLDRHDHFKNPVSKQDVPDYFDIIKKPMCWEVIDEKLDHHQYWDLQDFLDDVDLVLDNAMLYNKDGSVFFKNAQRIKKESRLMLANLDRLRFHHELLSSSGCIQPNELVSTYDPQESSHDDTMSDAQQTQSFVSKNSHRTLIGDLEPDLESLELLVSANDICEDLNIELGDSTPIASLFSYEFATVKPPPLDSPMAERMQNASAIEILEGRVEGRKGGKRSKPKRDRKAEAERAKLNREAKEAAALVAPGALTGELQGTNRGDRQLEKQREREIQAALDASAGSRAPQAAPQAKVTISEADIEPSFADAEAGQMTSKSKKRPSVVPTTQPIVPRVVSAVDDRDSFNLFNAGWILPPDQKRGGRAPLTLQQSQTTQPPPKKKQKFDHLNSGVGTSVGDKPLGETDLAVETSNGSRAVSYVTDDIDVPHNVVTQPNGTVIIEKLDTPAIRRERSMRRKAERQRQAEATISAGSSHKEDLEIESAPSIPQNNIADGKEQGFDFLNDESDLSELSDDETELSNEAQEERVVEEKHPVTKLATTRQRKPPRRPPRVEQYVDSTIVWAKSESFPWWPAVVFAETNEQVPKNILEAHKQKKAKRKIKLFIVQYYDKQESWQSVPRDKLLMLGEDEKLDQEMLGTSSKQKWKASASRKDCREAYRQALASMDVVSHVAETSDG